ncbi:hypothetical protein ASG52_19855 [Methylobacterium sp. Leaf456]|uniref:hypothetical protein n=1 Tax=Methylobacterium sp. Leaf456 TaxID=1736382 RepID=UPI0006FB7B26|nr:hypothetical protein [Methylobacterium sp. Leaf456]KQT59983.1 hypothetical protein ASG52_19855 [Methylobacterium sp. Leaf456]
MAPEPRRRLIQAVADNMLERTKREIRAAGVNPDRYKTFLDGRQVQNLDGLNPDHCTITYQFQAGVPPEVVHGCLDLLRANSPAVTGRYRESHRVYADKADVTDALPLADDKAEAVKEYVIMPTVPYARKVEKWDGVYEGVTVMAQRRYGNSAEVYFEFRSPILPYVPGAWGKADRAALREQPNRIKTMQRERETRLPCIFIRPLGA